MNIARFLKEALAPKGMHEFAVLGMVEEPHRQWLRDQIIDISVNSVVNPNEVAGMVKSRLFAKGLAEIVQEVRDICDKRTDDYFGTEGNT